MVWDKDTPAGNTKISQGDDTIRSNNSAIEDALGLEHDFATGASQTGRHKHPAGTSSGSPNDRDDASPALIDGSFFLADDVRTGEHVLQFRNGGAWDNVDVNPTDILGDPTIPRVDEQSQFKSAQFSRWHQITLSSGTGPGGIDEIPVDLTQSAKQWVLLAGNDVQLKIPTGTITAYGTVIEIEIIQDGVGGANLSYESTGYVAANSVAPVIGTDANRRSVLVISETESGPFLVTAAPSIGGI